MRRARPGQGGRVQDEASGRSRQGTVTVLALLFSLLLGYAPAAAASADVDRGAVRLGKTEAGKANVLLRSGGRLQNDEGEGGRAACRSSGAGRHFPTIPASGAGGGRRV
jgi:hypothetical protein